MVGIRAMPYIERWLTSGRSSAVHQSKGNRTLAKDRVKQDIGPKEQLEDWFDIDWQTVDKRVRNLRQRIYRATQNAQWNKVRSLMKLMLRSYSNLLQTVRKITQENHGRKTAGIDGQKVLTPKARVKLVREMLEFTTWKVRPARRVYIPKANGKQRPLGILTIKNRVAQAIVKSALEPSWEARFEPNSYGFRPGRSCHDAIEHCWIKLNRQGKDKWVLDADVKSAFDNISHEHILKRLGNIPGRELIKQWLKAGYVEADILHATASGVPQGGVVSPVIANIALDGLQQLLDGKLGFVRYADDFIVTAKSKEQIEAVVPAIEEWLAERGLMLNHEKTKIVSINDGFNFLGFNVRHYQGKCLIKPEKAKVLDFLASIRKWLSDKRQAEAAMVIRYLNPIIIGWANYYRHAVSKETFSYVSHQIWKAIWTWCTRRHPHKTAKWVKKKYFKIVSGKDWRFFTMTHNAQGEQIRLMLADIAATPITRHVKVKGAASPDDPSLREYWLARRTRENKKATTLCRNNNDSHAASVLLMA
jgi:RNA-directed DNA polymerase